MGRNYFRLKAPFAAFLSYQTAQKSENKKKGGILESVLTMMDAVKLTFLQNLSVIFTQRNWGCKRCAYVKHSHKD